MPGPGPGLGSWAWAKAGLVLGLGPVCAGRQTEREGRIATSNSGSQPEGYYIEHQSRERSAVAVALAVRSLIEQEMRQPVSARQQEPLCEHENNPNTKHTSYMYTTQSRRSTPGKTYANC